MASHECTRLDDNEIEKHWTAIQNSVFNYMGVKLFVHSGGDGMQIIYVDGKQTKSGMELLRVFIRGVIAGRKTVI